MVGVVREASQLRPDVAIEITRLDEATVSGDAHRLQQLLLNVFDNALRVTPPRRTVAVQLTVAGPDATITISDQGPGHRARSAHQDLRPALHPAGVAERRAHRLRPGALDCAGDCAHPQRRAQRPQTTPTKGAVNPHPPTRRGRSPRDQRMMPVWPSE